ncbi:M16 family metallopeptidase [Oleiharenicola lentus]|uniref:M16 family metallopeptidase n=1 Tax=Oleiharenicola lentus TaxID=2508720 RepID=UPI003F675256
MYCSSLAQIGRLRRPALPVAFHFFLVAWAFVLAAASLSAAQGWPHERSDLAPDPAIKWGQLENGLRYVIRKNTEPRGRVALVLQVNVGSVHERADQLGYAHFVEHMMFRGTRRFPANSLVGTLQREGLSMGADSSAFTNYVSTFYNLDLPHNSREKITLGLSILRDFADGATLDRKNLKLEGNVIESERRTRDSSGARIGEALNDFLQPGTLFSQRPPIGTLASVRAATPEKLRAFHQQWYRPSRMVLIAVGDAEPAELEKLIRENFDSLKPADSPEPRDPDLTFPVPPEDFQVRFFPTPSEGGTSVLLYSVSSFQPRADSIAHRRELIVQNAAAFMLHNRLGEIIRKTPADFGVSEVSWTSHPHAGQLAFVRVDARRDLWRTAVRFADQELRRALHHGFTKDEIAVQIQAFRNWYQESIRNAPSRESTALAEQIRSCLESDIVVTSPEDDWAQSEQIVASLNPEACLAAFRKFWETGNRRLAVIGHYVPELTVADLKVAYDESNAVTFFGAKEEHELGSFAYTDFGPAGKIASRRHEHRVDVESLEFANGVRLNVKKTDYEKNLVHVRVRLGDGFAQEPADKPGLGLLTTGAFLAGGLGRYDSSELGRILAGDSLSCAFTVEENAFYFTGHAAPDKLERLLQLITAFFTDPAFRPEGFASSLSQLQAYYSSALHEPSEFLSAATPSIMANGDTRYGLPHIDHLFERTPQEMQDWLKPALAKAPIEIGIAGELETESVVAIVSRTLGTLPERQLLSNADLARKPSLPMKASYQAWKMDTTEAKAAVRVYWPGVDTDDYRGARRLQVLGDILNDRLRLKIREELGATYGSTVESWGSEKWPGYGYLCAMIETSPQKAEQVAKLTRKIAADIAAKGITDEEFARAMEPRFATLDQQLRSNSYWTYHVLSRMQETPTRIQWPLTRNDDYRAMLRRSVESYAKTSLKAERAHVFIAVPAK